MSSPKKVDMDRTDRSVSLGVFSALEVLIEESFQARRFRVSYGAVCRYRRLLGSRRWFSELWLLYRSNSLQGSSPV